MDEKRHEDAEAEFGVGVVGGVGDEAFGEFVQGDGDGGLEPDGEEGVGGDVVVVGLGGVVGWISAVLVLAVAFRIVGRVGSAGMDGRAIGPLMS